MKININTHISWRKQVEYTMAKNFFTNSTYECMERVFSTKILYSLYENYNNFIFADATEAGLYKPCYKRRVLFIPHKPDFSDKMSLPIYVYYSTYFFFHTSNMSPMIFFKSDTTTPNNCNKSVNA